jgi:MFS transporter, SP family, sugar:H+ symporter
MSVPVFTQWVFNALIVLVFPAMLNQLATSITFGILALFALIQLVFALKFMKETKGKSLEEIEIMWGISGDSLDKKKKKPFVVAN